MINIRKYFCKHGWAYTCYSGVGILSDNTQGSITEVTCAKCGNIKYLIMRMGS